MPVLHIEFLITTTSMISEEGNIKRISQWSTHSPEVARNLCSSFIPMICFRKVQHKQKYYISIIIHQTQNSLHVRCFLVSSHQHFPDYHWFHHGKQQIWLLQNTGAVAFLVLLFAIVL